MQANLAGNQLAFESQDHFPYMICQFSLVIADVSVDWCCAITQRTGHEVGTTTR